MHYDTYTHPQSTISIECYHPSLSTAAYRLLPPSTAGSQGWSPIAMSFMPTPSSPYGSSCTTSAAQPHPGGLHVSGVGEWVSE